ncbi:hypothetical protein ISS37_00020 [candidate division KSB1 bacterium]|nr:hypothetical protein [candidate division KSB1 bacterium]
MLNEEIETFIFTPKLAYSILHQDMRELVLVGENSILFQSPGVTIAPRRAGVCPDFGMQNADC